MLKSSNSRIVSDVNHVVVLVIKLRLQQNASESFSNHHAIRFPVSNSSLRTYSALNFERIGITQ